MTQLDPHAEPSRETWRALRALLAGQASPPSASAELAQAAKMGEVEVLALEALPDLEPWLAAAVRQRAEHSVVVGFAEARVAEVMAAAATQRWAALKGSASAYALYSDPSHRARRDVDILVHPDDISDVSRAARAAGWEDVTHATHLAGSAHAPFEREWMVPLGGHRVGCDVHRRLLRWTEFSVDASEVLARSQVLDSGWRICALSDLLLHTALHAANAAFRVPLRSWLDVHRMVASPELDWERVLRTSRAWHAQRCVWATLVIIERWFGASAPKAVMAALAPSARTAERLLRDLEGQGAWPGSRPWGRVGRARLRMRLRDTPRDALSYVWQTVTREVSDSRWGVQGGG